jgi:hypothetical protein
MAMLENTATQAHKIKYALRMEKQIDTVDDDRFGGSALNWPGEGDSFPPESDMEFQAGPEFYTDASMNGTQFNGFKQKTAELPAVSNISVKGYVRGLERILLAGLGYASVEGPDNGTHRFIVPPQGRNQREYTAEEKALIGSAHKPGDLVNLYLCISQELGPYARHARNVIIKDFEISCTAKSPLQITASGPAERIDKEPSKASVKKWTTAPGDFPPNVYQMSDFEVWLGSLKVSVTEFSLKISHGLSDDNVPTGTSNGGLSRAEPMPSGKSSITLDITVYLHDKSIYEDWMNNQEKVFCRIEGKRGAYKFIMLLPMAQVTNAQPNFDGAGSTQLTLEACWPTDADGRNWLENNGYSLSSWQFPQESVLGIVYAGPPDMNRNPMRDMEITGEA